MVPAWFVTGLAPHKDGPLEWARPVPPRLVSFAPDEASDFTDTKRDGRDFFQAGDGSGGITQRPRISRAKRLGSEPYHDSTSTVKLVVPRALRPARRKFLANFGVG